MLDIAWRVHQQIPEIVFVVAGDGGQLQELRQEVSARKMDAFVFCIGQIDDMRACYKDSVLTLICSLKEGLSLTAYESLSMGVPVVSSDVGGQKDLIGKDVGETAQFGGLLGYAPIMPVNEFGCETFISRQGRIPAPIHSFKN